MRRSFCLSKSVFRGVCVSILLALIGCRTEAHYVVPEEPMPPNTVLLSQMMRELSATPGFTDALLAQLDKDGKKGPALMTPALLKKLRELILGKDGRDWIAFLDGRCRRLTRRFEWLAGS